MARKKHGVCHICLEPGPLSFEHVPPKSAFNDRPVVEHHGRALLNRHPDELFRKKGRINQRGSGAHTLCPKCNNDTGSWYGPSYAGWAYQGIRLIDHAETAPQLYHLFYVYPLKVIKQIVCMFFSANPPSFSENQPWLRRFVLNRYLKYIPPNIRIFSFFNSSPISRQSSITGRIEFGGGSNIYSETAFPPFGYILSVDGKCPDDRLFEISHFAEFGYDDFREIPVRIPVFSIYSWVPGDFRSREQVLKEMENRGES